MKQGKSVFGKDYFDDLLDRTGGRSRKFAAAEASKLRDLVAPGGSGLGALAPEV